MKIKVEELYKESMKMSFRVHMLSFEMGFVLIRRYPTDWCVRQVTMPSLVLEKSIIQYKPKCRNSYIDDSQDLLIYNHRLGLFVFALSPFNPCE